MSVVDAILDDEPTLFEEFKKLTPVNQIAFNWQMKWLKAAHKHQIEPAGIGGPYGSCLQAVEQARPVRRRRP